MAIETLKDVKAIGPFPIIVMDELREKYPDKFNPSGAMDWEWFEKEIRPNYFIYVRNDKNSISFTLQNGPIGEKGINGCQVNALIETAKIMIDGLNKKFPCRENALAITKLDEALLWLFQRTINRIQRGVEGTSQS